MKEQQNQATNYSDMPTDAQLVKAWNKIEAMTPYQKIIVAEVAPRFPAIWIKCAKMFIDCYGSNIVIFNSDYTVLTRQPN